MRTLLTVLVIACLVAGVALASGIDGKWYSERKMERDGNTMVIKTTFELKSDVGEETYFWGEHLFIGCETHNKLDRAPRAFGRRTDGFSDALEYHEVADLRIWARTKPSPLLLHEKILAEHCYIAGPSGSGKSSLGIIPLLMQLMRGAQTKDEKPAPPHPVIILDLKGDPALSHTARIEAERRARPEG